MREKRSNERGREDNGPRRSVSQVCRLAISPTVFLAPSLDYCVIFDRYLVFDRTLEVASSMRGGQIGHFRLV